MFSVVTTRFNDETWSENLNYREKNNIKCVYCSPFGLSPNIIVNSGVFVVEMNNSKNKIEGVGFIKNRPCMEKYYSVYRDGFYNRFVYKGNYYMNRETLLGINEKLVMVLDYILFKEKTHSKRGCCFTSIPEKVMKHPFCENINIKNCLRDIFVKYYS